MECRTCEFYRTKPELPEGTGQCLANSPTIVVMGGEAKAMYAAVEAGARCRHYQKAKFGLPTHEPEFTKPDRGIPVEVFPAKSRTVSPVLQQEPNVAPLSEELDDMLSEEE